MTHPAAPPAEPASPRAAERAAELAFAAGVQMRTLRALDAELAALEQEPRDADRVGKLETIANSVHRASRALRLTLSLEEQFELDREVRVREAMARAEKRAAERTEALRARKRAHLGFALERAIETAQDLYAGSKIKERLDRVERLVERESVERDRFLARPLRETLDRLCAELEIKVRPGLWREADWAEVDPPAADRPTPPAPTVAAAAPPGPRPTPPRRRRDPFQPLIPAFAGMSGIKSPAAAASPRN